MTEKLRQSLSAAMDDEADAFELRRVMDELDRDEDLRGVWMRYHLIGAALRGDGARSRHRAVDAEMQDRVWAAVHLADTAEASAGDGEQGTVAASARPGRVRPGAWLGPVTGLAVAATVAFAVVVGFDALRPTGPDAAVTAAVAPAAGPVSAIADASVSRARPVTEVSAADLRRAQAYMLHHAQQQALNQAGMMSLVKMATYEKP